MNNLRERVARAIQEDWNTDGKWIEQLEHEDWLYTADQIIKVCMEEAQQKIRRDCNMCNEGYSHADPSGMTECEYCGRPMHAIRALIPEKQDG